MPALAALDGVHVGVPMRFFRDGLDAQIRQCLDESLKVFERAGAMVKEVPDFPYEEINALSSMMIRVEAGAAHQRALAAHPVRYSVELAGWLQQAGGVPAMLYEKAHHLRGELLKQYLTTVMKDVHVLHVPVMRLPTPSLEEARQNGTAADQVRIELTRLTRPFSYFGLPALSLPCGYAKTSAGDELPTAFQLIGHPFDDARLLGIGAFYQRVTDWHKHRPPLFSGRDDLSRPTPRGDQ
jgi:aspartyl-tRNA(Asn)/glutamyl-tRNA(Gln) amidotransferase subunit A